MKPSYASEEIKTLARELLADGRAEPTSFSAVRAALDSVLGSFQGHLKGLIGEGGFRSLLALSQRRAMESFPVLEKVRVEKYGKLSLVDPRDAGSLEEEEDALALALVALLAEFLVLVRALARDQDWSVVNLWPELVSLKAAGLFPRPGADSG